MSMRPPLLEANAIFAGNETSGWTRREVLGSLGAAAVTLSLSEVVSATTPTFPAGAVIRTILKDYPPDELGGGATLFHEHMSFAPDFLRRFAQYGAETNAAAGLPPPAPAPAQNDLDLAFMQDLDVMVEELTAAKREGVGCIVDGGHPDMGRSITFLRQLSVKSGVPIVAGAGFYTEPFYPKEIGTMSEEQVVRALVKQVETDPVGAFGEIGSWDYMTANERKVFRAIGKAHLATNLPIFTHTGIPGKAALEQLDILEDAGVNPNRVVIGHLGNLIDPTVQVHKAICKRGAYVGFDRLGGPADDPQVPMVMALIEAGFADRVMLSSDLARPNAIKRNGGPGYAKTLTVFVPKLRAARASDEVIQQIIVDNPRRFLSFVPKKRRPA
jgi:predicted metal-dependent phosphotriesterase family hydrolase